MGRVGVLRPGRTPRVEPTLVGRGTDAYHGPARARAPVEASGLSTTVRRGDGERARVTALAAALAWAALSGATAEATDHGPRLRVSQTLVDLGVVQVGSPAEARYSLENTGDAPLEILSVESGCKCAVVDHDPLVAPGSVGFVRARLDTTELQGEVTKGIYVKTNDPKQPQLMLTFKALVVSTVELLPQRVIYVREREGEGAVGRLLVRPLPAVADAFAVKDLTPSSSRVVATAERVDHARPRAGGLPEARAGDWVIEVRLRPGAPRVGPLREKVSFHTGIERQPQITFEVESTLEAPLSVSSERVMLVPDQAGQAVGTLFVSVRPGLDPAALAFTASPASIEIEGKRVAERMLKLVLRRSGPCQAAGTLALRLGQESVELPVLCPTP